MVFGDVSTKQGNGWRDRGGVAGYRAHVEQILARFDHVALHADTWPRVVPTTSSTAHALVKAAALVHASKPAGASLEPPTLELAWRLRVAFFRDGRDVSRLDVQLAVAEEMGLSPPALRARLDDGSALKPRASPVPHGYTRRTSWTVMLSRWMLNSLQVKVESALTSGALGKRTTRLPSASITGRAGRRSDPDPGARFWTDSTFPPSFAE